MKNVSLSSNVSPPRAFRKGFTLIELSIVLVIIGLIVGGVLVGRDLIAAAKLRKDISTMEQLNTAVNTFRNKYNCLPGDCANATTFLSGAVNGNGDGVIGFLNPNYNGGGVGCSGYYAASLDGSHTNGVDNDGIEIAAVMDDLARANLIALAPYSSGGANGDSTYASTTGLGFPASATNPRFGMVIVSCLGVHYIVWGAVGSTPWVLFNSAHTTPIPVFDAMAIDNKLDDGLANSGRVMHRISLNSTSLIGTATGDTCVDNSFVYTPNSSLSTQYCTLGIRAAF